MNFPLFQKRIDQDVVLALRWKLPESLEVDLQGAEEGGFVVSVKTLPGCFTQAENEKELFEMVNNAVLTYLQIPKEYQPYMPSFFPKNEELRKAMQAQKGVLTLERA
ncbi:MAG: type II toxin-antitoxin system HicB family antitoxin [Patescibacteria group bacterium]